MRARGGSLARGLAMAGIAGLATVPYLLAMGPLMGATNAVALGSVAAVAVYLATIAPSLASGVRIALVAGALGGALALATPGRASAVLAAVVVLGVLRSGFLYRMRPARGLVIEIALLGGGLALASLVTGSGILHAALAVWAFFLVQSLYGVVGGIEARARDDEGVDPFVRARDEANRLMEELPAG